MLAYSLRAVQELGRRDLYVNAEIIMKTWLAMKATPGMRLQTSAQRYQNVESESYILYSFFFAAS